MRAASPLLAMPGGKPRKPRVSAGHPDESGCGAHECARHGAPSPTHAGIRSRFLRERPPAPGLSFAFAGRRPRTNRVEDTLAGNRSLRIGEGIGVPSWCTYSCVPGPEGNPPLLATRGGKPRKPRVFARHPDEPVCGAHQCALDGLPSHPRAGSLPGFLRERSARLEEEPASAKPGPAGGMLGSLACESAIRFLQVVEVFYGNARILTQVIKLAIT
jgi:hypothetical protein